jgi:preprotein translocase subunit SecF
LALIIGFSVGAYSSIFIASTLLAWWRERKGESNINYTPKPIDANVDNS